MTQEMPQFLQAGECGHGNADSRKLKPPQGIVLDPLSNKICALDQRQGHICSSRHNHCSGYTGRCPAMIGNGLNMLLA